MCSSDLEFGQSFDQSEDGGLEDGDDVHWWSFASIMPESTRQPEQHLKGVTSEMKNGSSISVQYRPRLSV